MATLTELRDRREDLIRKGLDGSVFIAPYSENTEISKLVGSSGLEALPPEYKDVGFLTKDQGVNWTREIDTSEVESLGAGQPTRIDTTKDVTGLEFTAQESKALNIELYEGVNLSDVAASAGDSSHVNVSWDKADKPSLLYYRAFVLFKDGEGADAFYFARWLPKCLVTDRGDQSWNEEDEIQYPITLTAFVDREFGTSCRTLWGIPTKMVDSMGFKPVSGG